MKTSTLSTVIQWLIVLGVIALIAWFFLIYRSFSFQLNLKHITGFEAILFAISVAFVWVYKLRWLHFIKPFNCLPCMTGWVALITALLYHVPNAIMYLFIGVFIGSVFEAIKMRWL